MATHKKPKKQRKVKSKAPPIIDMPTQISGDIQVHYDDRPIANPDHKLHPRIELPAVTRGKKVTDSTPSAPVHIDKEA